MCHWQNNNSIDYAAVRIIGNGGEKTRGELTIAAFSMQIVSGEWWCSPCELRIRRDKDSPNKNPIVVSYHQVVMVALKMRQEHSRILGNLISWIPLVWLCKSSDLLLNILVSHLQAKFIGSGLVKIKTRTSARGSGLIGSNY